MISIDDDNIVIIVVQSKWAEDVLQEGSMRCDVNVSVRPQGQEQLGTKVEVKNMNSFSAMQKAIDFEIDRQVCHTC